MNLAALLHRAACRSPFRTAVAVGSRAHQSYRDLALRAAMLGNALRSDLRMRAGERAAIVMSNTPAHMEIFWGCLQAGIATVPMHSKLHPAEIEYCLRRCGAQVCFADSGTEPAVREAVVRLQSAPHAASACEVIVAPSSAGASACASDTSPYASFFRGPTAERLAGLSGYELGCTAAPMVSDGGEEDLAWLFFTSGTTGKPKPACISHANLRAVSSSYFTDLDAIDAHHSMVHCAPISHGSGFNMIPHVQAAACNVFPESGGFNPRELLELLPSHAGATTFLAPTMIQRLCDQADADGGASAAARENLKAIMYGGGPMYVTDLKRAMATFGDDRFVQIYGQGETPMTITSLRKAHHMELPSAQRNRQGGEESAVEVRVASDSGEMLPEGEVGEVLVRGATVMKGYLDDAEATAAAFHQGGWLRTGDLGFFSPRGFLTLTDRTKHVIISGGSNIYPREVEEVLLAHPLVREAAVVGVPDERWGERVEAFVVADAGAAAAGGVGAGGQHAGGALAAEALEGSSSLESSLEEQLDALCLSHISRHKRPKRYWRVEELPKTSLGKVPKALLEELRRREELRSEKS